MGNAFVAMAVFSSARCLGFSFELTRFFLSDYIIIGSDSGRIVVLEYDSATNKFNKLHQETYGRSGARRIVPGQHIATDPKGRAVMLGAMEKSKLVYILNRVGRKYLELEAMLGTDQSNFVDKGRGS
jgi:splicing factor 3B subunit 3